MIAYLFFHEHAAEADEGQYEEGLRRFHASLAAARIPGFVGSRTYRTDSQYCDWYLVESSAALDPLNDAAVSGERSAPHAVVAREAVKFAGKLLKLAAGEYQSDASTEIRFSKPAGMMYPDLYRKLEPWTGKPDVSLWRRMMVLGPAPEFCLLAKSEVTLPADLNPQVLRRLPV